MTTIVLLFTEGDLISSRLKLKTWRAITSMTTMSWEGGYFVERETSTHTSNKLQLSILSRPQSIVAPNRAAKFCRVARPAHTFSHLYTLTMFTTSAPQREFQTCVQTQYSTSVRNPVIPRMQTFVSVRFVAQPWCWFPVACQSEEMIHKWGETLGVMPWNKTDSHI